VIEVFRRDGFADAAEVGTIGRAGEARLRVR
jgi:hypothetical protein